MSSTKNIFLLFLFSCSSLLARDKHIDTYIESYQDIAISEMERTGVPASIKLAQGILESNAGRSTLARKAKNHFGIKCGNKWRGKKHHLKDDDYKNGKLVKSCFRVYKNSGYSYQAHSDFLLDNRRYSSLFKLKRTDYKKWAKGLKKAGYATSRTYDKKLIRIIEDYKLYKYDKMSSEDRVTKTKKKNKLPTDIFYINDAKMTFVKLGETPTSIAQRTKTSVSRILAYNEMIDLANEPLPTDTKVFIQKKRRNFRGKQRSHTVLVGETMYDISQSYGLCLDRLYKKNKMSKGTQPAVGESIAIRGKARRKPRLRRLNPGDIPPPVLIPDTPPTDIETETKPPKEEKEDLKPILTPTDKEPLPPTTPEILVPIEEEKEVLPENDPPKIETPIYHTVVKGETLWRISKKYGTTVEALQRLNNLNTDNIKTGMKLRVE